MLKTQMIKVKGTNDVLIVNQVVKKDQLNQLVTTGLKSLSGKMPNQQDDKGRLVLECKEEVKFNKEDSAKNALSVKKN